MREEREREKGRFIETNRFTFFRFSSLFAAAAAARNVVASQQPEVTNDSVMRAVNTVRKEEEEDGNLQQANSHEEEEMEKIDSDASFSQQASTIIEEPPPPTPARTTTPDVSTIRKHLNNQDGETSFEQRTRDAGVVQEDAHADILPRCDNDDAVCDQDASSACVEAKTAEMGNNEDSQLDRSTSAPCSSQNNNEEKTDNNGNKIQNRRVCLKRKHDSVEETPSSAPDWHSSSKVACVMHHRTSTPEPSSSPSPNLNGFFSVLKTATLHSSNSENGGGDDDGNSSPVAPLSRSLSCSSFMELTCES